MRLIDADQFGVVSFQGKSEDFIENEDFIKGVLFILDKIYEAPTVDRPHGTCKTCKHYNPYRDQFSYGYRGDGYCKSTITNSEGQAYINCHDEWYCANYEKAGEKE